MFNQLRLISKRCKSYIDINENSIRFIILSDEEIEIQEDPDLYRLYTQIVDKFDKMKSDFSYSTVIKFENGKIVIRTDEMEYTDRKLKLALKGLDISKFKMYKVIEPGIWDNIAQRHKIGEVFNIIEKK